MKKRTSKQRQIQSDLDEYEVERIVSKRSTGRKIEYLVKWVGYSDEENSWLNKKDLKNCKALIEEYERQCLIENENEQKKQELLKESSLSILPDCIKEDECDIIGITKLSGDHYYNFKTNNNQEFLLDFEDERFPVKRLKYLEKQII